MELLKMPKYRFFIDLWPGLNPSQFGLTATTQPLVKGMGVKRVAFDVEIPDEVLRDLDWYGGDVEVEEVNDS